MTIEEKLNDFLSKQMQDNFLVIDVLALSSDLFNQLTEELSFRTMIEKRNETDILIYNSPFGRVRVLEFKND